MNGKTVLSGLDSAWRSEVAQIKDPLAGGTFQIENKGMCVVEVVTLGAENRALPDATGFGVGQELMVCFRTDGGDLTLTGAESNVVLKDAGDVAIFRVSKSGTSKVWRCVCSSAAAVDNVDFATAPVNVTGSRGANAALASLLTALAALGVITDSTSA
jgi:hypothetical protein